MSPNRRISEGGLSALKSPTGPPPRATFKPVERPDPVPVADLDGYVLTPQQEFEHPGCPTPDCPTAQWVELPDQLIQRIYALDLGDGVDDLDDRIGVLAFNAECQQALPVQCPYESDPDANGFVYRCLRPEHNKGPHYTRRDVPADSPAWWDGWREGRVLEQDLNALTPRAQGE
jgi:hypothetical protein